MGVMRREGRGGKSRVWKGAKKRRKKEKERFGDGASQTETKRQREMDVKINQTNEVIGEEARRQIQRHAAKYRQTKRNTNPPKMFETVRGSVCESVTASVSSCLSCLLLCLCLVCHYVCYVFFTGKKAVQGHKKSRKKPAKPCS